jgi:hypothetical protein
MRLGLGLGLRLRLGLGLVFRLVRGYLQVRIRVRATIRGVTIELSQV